MKRWPIRRSTPGRPCVCSSAERSSSSREPARIAPSRRENGVQTRLIHREWPSLDVSAGSGHLSRQTDDPGAGHRRARDAKFQRMSSARTADSLRGLGRAAVRRARSTSLAEQAVARLDRLATERAFTRMIHKTDNFGDVTWLGNPIWQNVLDLWTLQEAISELRPSVILETGSNRGGSALFFANLFDLMGQGRVVTVDVEALHSHTHPRVDFLIGSSLAPEILARMEAAASEATGPVMVILDSDHSRDHVLAELRAYAPLVSAGSLLLAQDGVIDELPLWKAARPGPLPAIREFLSEQPDFVVDQRWNRRFGLTHHPDGWL